MVNHGHRVRSLVVRLAGCLPALPDRSVEILLLAAGVRGSGPRSPKTVARAMHMTVPHERAAESAAISQLRAAGGRGCQAAVPSASTAVPLSTGGAVSGVDALLPAAWLTTAAETVASLPAAAHRASSGRVHTMTAAAHRVQHQAGRGVTLNAASIGTPSRGGMWPLWTFLLLGLLLAAALVAAGRDRFSRWASLTSGSILGAGAIGRIGSRRSGARETPSRAAVLAAPEALQTDPATEPGQAPGSSPEVAATTAAEVPPYFHTTPAEEIAAPPGGWAAPVGEAEAPVDDATTSGASPAGPGPSQAAAPVPARQGWRSHRSAMLRIAGAGLAAAVAFSTRTQRRRSRR